MRDSPKVKVDAKNPEVIASNRFHIHHIISLHELGSEPKQQIFLKTLSFILKLLDEKPNKESFLNQERFMNFLEDLIESPEPKTIRVEML